MIHSIQIDPEAIRAEAQKAAWEFDTLDEACPYPFASVKGVIFKDEFLTAQQLQRNLSTLPLKGNS